VRFEHVYELGISSARAGDCYRECRRDGDLDVPAGKRSPQLQSRRNVLVRAVHRADAHRDADAGSVAVAIAGRIGIAVAHAGRIGIAIADAGRIGIAVAHADACHWYDPDPVGAALYTDRDAYTAGNAIIAVGRHLVIAVAGRDIVAVEFDRDLALTCHRYHHKGT
jgi:hypothetical protein